MRTKTRSQKAKNFKKKRVFVPTVVFIILVAVFVYVTYSILNHYATEIVSTYLTEVVAHDKANIKDYVADRYSMMNMIYTDLDLRGIEGVDNILDELHIKSHAHNVETLYLMDADGNLYSSNYDVIGNEDNPFHEFFRPGKTYFVDRYDEVNAYYDYRKEYMLYSYDFHDSPLVFGADDPEFVGMIMLRDINYLREKMRITSFDGRGYTSIVDENGTYVVLDGYITSMGQIRNCFDFLKGQPINGMTMEEIITKFNARESFTFWYTDVYGTEKFVLFSPSNDTDWTFLSSIEKSVYSDQLQRFIELIAFIMGGLFLILLIAFLLYRHSRKKLAAFYSSVANGIRSRQYYDDQVVDSPVNALAVVDIDHLKRINDTYGHLVGDIAIREMALILMRHTGSYGEICRFGGDEFVVAFQRDISSEDFISALKMTEDEVRQIRLDEHPDFKMSLSIGAYYGGGTAEEIFAKADELLYEAKKERNRIISNISIGEADENEKVI